MIPVANPRANYRAHRIEIRRAIHNILENGRYIGGKHVAVFEKEFAAYIGTKYAVGVNSGTDALIIAMKALGIGSGHEVKTIAGTAVATVAAILAAGAIPVLVNDGPTDITVHLYGQAADVIGTIEDCAQACGGFYGDRRLGSIGRIGCFSFYPTKNLGAIGDGGMIVTSDAEIAEKCRCIREYGWNAARMPKCQGINSRLDPLQAAILRVKLKYLDEENDKRRAIAYRYALGLKDVVLVPDQSNHCFHLYVIECEKRDKLAVHLRKRGIHTAVHYPAPIHRQAVYEDLVRAGDLRKTEQRALRILSLPMYPELTISEVDEVIDGVRSFYS